MTADRLVAANEATAWGQGGIAAVSRACGLSRRGIRDGLAELRQGAVLPVGRVRRPGGGRKSLAEHDPALAQALDDLVADDARGDPESPLRGTCKSTRVLAQTLTRQRHPVSHTKVAQLLQTLDYSLQANRKQNQKPNRQMLSVPRGADDFHNPAYVPTATYFPWSGLDPR